jgi:hypothetical protein
MKKVLSWRTVNHVLELVAEGDLIKIYVDKKFAGALGLEDIWDLVVDRLSNLSCSTNSGLLRRSYAAKKVVDSYREYLKMIKTQDGETLEL